VHVQQRNRGERRVVLDARASSLRQLQLRISLGRELVLVEPVHLLERCGGDRCIMSHTR
jgi:hypothetical protein